ncbi:MAG TPA: protoporphyrinogen oxidase [Acidimicrobiales bacterium]|nr:protoporphyrinogen oxidase [Acidimicrobiales bacterium]
MARASIVIVGGGVSALAAAWELSGAAAGPSEHTARIELIESGPHLGGSLATTKFAGRTIDLGPDGFLARRPEATDLITELAMADQLEPINASGASLYLRGALYEIPAGLALGVPTSSAALRHFGGLSWRARLHARRDELWPARLEVGEDAAIGEIVRTKLGRELAYQFIEPMVGGIQAGRIDQLSAGSVFPTLLEAARRGGSLMKALRAPAAPAPSGATTTTPMFYSLNGGMGSLVERLESTLRERGVVLRTSAAVRALHRGNGDYTWEVDTDTTATPAHAIVMAAPGAVAGELLSPYGAAFEALTHIESAGAAMVTFALARENVALPEHGTGILVPLGTHWRGPGSMMVTAVTFLDRKWPRLVREHDVVLRAHVGRIDDDRWASMSDEELAARVADELAVLLARFVEPSEVLVQRWPQGLPQYYVHHADMVARAKAASAALHVALAGNAYDGVGIPASIGSGRRAAREVLSLLA